MHIRDILAKNRPALSFEFFPPKTGESQNALFETIRALEPLEPDFVSVTYGAGGGTRELTHSLVERLKRETRLDPIPHLTCVGHTRGEILEIIERYARAGVSNILALRGDPPKDMPGHNPLKDAFPFARDLVREIRSFRGHPDARGFGIGVAGFPEGHPLTPNRLRELDHLKQKVDAGADYICTQLFFDNRDFYDFRDRCALEGIEVPILAGIMPVTSLATMERMAELAGGTRFPARLLKALRRAQGSQEAVRQVGLHHATEQCADLLHQGVAGIHFYTLNQSRATREIALRLGWSARTGSPEP